VVQLPHIVARVRAVGPPGVAEALHLCWRWLLLVSEVEEGVERLLHAKVAGGKHVGTFELEDHEDMARPETDAFDGGESLDELLVAGSLQQLLGQTAVAEVRGEVDDVQGLALASPAARRSACAVASTAAGVGGSALMASFSRLWIVAATLPASCWYTMVFTRAAKGVGWLLMLPRFNVPCSATSASKRASVPMRWAAARLPNVGSGTRMLRPCFSEAAVLAAIFADARRRAFLTGVAALFSRGVAGAASGLARVLTIRLILSRV